MCMLQADIAGEVYRSVCVGNELWRLWENDLKKKMNVPGVQNAEGGEGEEGVCMHERKLVVATKVRGLCGCKRLTKIII